MSRRRPRSLIYPTQLIEQGIGLLNKKLHRLRRSIERGDLTKLEGREEGHRVLEQHYRDQLDILNKFVEGKGLTGVMGSEKDLQDALEEAKGRWSRLVDDLD